MTAVSRETKPATRPPDTPERRRAREALLRLLAEHIIAELKKAPCHDASN